jgi:hypothetical protein
MCILGDGSTATLLYSPANFVVAGQLYHLACVWDGANLQLYVNGALNTSVPQNIIPAANSPSLYIGQFGGDVDRVNGIIDEVRIYNLALTQAQVQRDMNTPQ